MVARWLGPEVNIRWITFNNCRLRGARREVKTLGMTQQNLPGDIEVYDLGGRRLYAKTSGGVFALFEDELKPEELMAIAQDIAARQGAPAEPVPSGGG